MLHLMNNQIYLFQSKEEKYYLKSLDIKKPAQMSRFIKETLSKFWNFNKV
jgi:hypothetical protein